MTSSGPNPRRELTVATVSCVAGAALALLAASRVWATELARRPAPLPAVTVTHTGGALLPWLPALALVGVAGAGALLATRGPARATVGVLVVLVSLGVIAAGAVGFGRVTGSRGGWPAAVMVGGLGIGWTGVRTIQRGRSWPAMGARYERGGGNDGGVATDSGAGQDRDAGADSLGNAGRRAGDPAAQPVREATRRATGDAAMWDNLDRGIDPTADE